MMVLTALKKYSKNWDPKETFDVGKEQTSLSWEPVIYHTFEMLITIAKLLHTYCNDDVLFRRWEKTNGSDVFLASILS